MALAWSHPDPNPEMAPRLLRLIANESSGGWPSHQDRLFLQVVGTDLTLVFLASEASEVFALSAFSFETSWELNLNLINNIYSKEGQDTIFVFNAALSEVLF